MKKPGFIITETIFSLVLAASVAAVAVLAVDLKTDRFHIDRFNPFSQSDSSTKTEKKETSDNTKPEQSRIDEISKTAETSKEVSTAEASSESSKEASDDEASKSEDSKPEESSSEAGNEDIKIISEPEELKAQPDELNAMLSRYGYTIENSLDGTKLIVVDTTAETGDKTKAVVYCYQKSSDSKYWWNIIGEGKTICDEAYIGENGSDFEPDYGSGLTPGGVFHSDEGFYIKEKPDTSFPMFEITEDTYWVTDPESEYYNQKVEGTEGKDWSSADHMITSEKSYKCGLVINYNTTSPDSGKASAIFLQCGSAPTEGSIAIPENVMKTILGWIDSDSRVNVFITV